MLTNLPFEFKLYLRFSQSISNTASFRFIVTVFMGLGHPCPFVTP